MKKQYVQPSRQKPQQGMTLIELMIAIALSLTLMAGAMQFLVSSRQTYDLTDDLSRIQENGRIALDILVRDIRMAGYRRPLNGDGVIPYYFDFQNACNAVNETCALDDHIDASGEITDGSDRLAVSYDPPEDDDRLGTSSTCLGTDLDGMEEDVIINVYTIDTVDNINSLYCRGYNQTTGAWIDDSAQPLIDGIENMQVLYGVTSSADPTGSVTRYISQDKIVEDDWAYIRAVRIALLVSNGLEDGFADAQERKYHVLNSAELTTADTDRHARRIYSTTVYLNNSSY